MSFFSRKKADRITEEKRQLDRELAELQREQKELQKRKVLIPAVLAARREEQSRQARERARSAQVTNISGVKQGIRHGRRGRTPSRRKHDEQKLCVLLLFILVVLGVIVWHAASSKGILP